MASKMKTELNINYSFENTTDDPFIGHKTATRLCEKIKFYGAKVSLEKNWLYLVVGAYKTKLYNVSLCTVACTSDRTGNTYEAFTNTSTQNYYGWDDCIKDRALPVLVDGKYVKNSNGYEVRGSTGCTQAFLYLLSQITINAVAKFEAEVSKESFNAANHGAFLGAKIKWE
jgi:hypothetical protein